MLFHYQELLYLFFSIGKPRDEHDPKIVELNKHIEEVVEQEQHVPPTKSNESPSGVTM
jgi:hypothetical protein